MLIDPVVLPTFAVASVVLALIPGPDMTFVMTITAARGVRSGLAGTAGIGLGLLFWVLGAAFGLTTLLAAEPKLLQLVRLAGAAYLLFLAFQMWRSRVDPLDLSEQKSSAKRNMDLRKDFRRGFLTNLLNPKVGLFFIAFLPQFVDERAGPLWVQILIFGALTSFIGLGFQVFTSFAIGRARKMVVRSQKAQQGMMKTSALVMLGLALWVFWKGVADESG